MDLREEIRRRREERHLSQEELAEAVGVSRQAVSKWESGAAQPTGANRRALLQALDLREAPAGPRLQSVRFYDEAMQEVLPEANWYDADRAVCLLVQWEGGTPATVQLVFTPAGSETAGEAQILAAALPLDGEHAALLSAAALRESGAGHLQILLDFGAEGIVRSEDAEKYNSLESLQDAVVITQSGSVQEALYNQYVNGACKEFKLVANMTDGYLAVAEGKADVCICNVSSADLYAQANGGMVTTDFRFEVDPNMNGTCVAMPTEGTESLAELVNQCIAELNESGQTAEWYTQYQSAAAELGIE